MHELSIAQSLIAAAEKAAREAGAVKVSHLKCRIGTLRQVDPWLLGEAFSIAQAGTLCEDAALSVEKTCLTVECPTCVVRFDVREWEWRCPTCGAEGRDPSGGTELELLSIDVETPDENRSSQESVPAER